MPKLITSNPKKRRKISQVRYPGPHSPFQKLVDAKRKQKQLSIRQLADKIGKNQGSVWIWLNSENGFPSKKSCSPATLDKLARVLNIPLPELKQAVDASRAIFTRAESPVPPPEYNAFDEFIKVLENDRRKVIRISTVINLAKRFRGS